MFESVIDPQVLVIFLQYQEKPSPLFVHLLKNITCNMDFNTNTEYFFFTRSAKYKAYRFFL